MPTQTYVFGYLAIAIGLGLSVFSFRHFQEMGRFAFAGLAIIFMGLTLVSGYPTSWLAIAFDFASLAILAFVAVAAFRQIRAARNK